MSTAALGLAGALLVAGCAGPAAPARLAEGAEGAQSSAGPKRLVVAVRSSPSILFYNKLNLASAGLGVNDFQRVLHAGLAQEDEEGTLRPQLAEVVPSVENGLWKVFPDGRMETTWKLRQGAQWHDGTPFTTSDLLFTATVWQDKDLPVFRDIAFDSIEGIEPMDSRTVVVTWRQPYIDADSMFTYTRGLPIPRHILERPYREQKETLQQHPYWGPEFVGMGAFKLKEVVQDSHLIFQANDGYALGRPKIDEVEVRFFPDPNVVAANLLAGAVEFVFDSRSFTFEQALQIRDQWQYGKFELTPGSWVTIFPQFLNPTPPVVADPQFRRALIMATDRQAMVETIQAGLSQVAHAYVHPRRIEYNAVERSIVRYDYDPRRAAQLIEGLGYARGPDGFFRDSANRPLEVELRTTVTDINRKSTVAVADYWQRFGVRVDQEVVAPQRAQDREYRATFPAFELIRPGVSLTQFQSWHTREIPLRENNWVGRNRSRYSNPEFNGLIEQYFVTIPVHERNQLLARIIHHMTDQQLLMGLFFDPGVVVVGNRLRNVIPGTLANIHEWEIR